MLRDAIWIRLVPFTAFVLGGSTLAQTTSRVSVDSIGSQADLPSGNPLLPGTVISADGAVVAFFSTATNLVPGDTNGFGDVFVHDMQSGTTTRVSVDSGGTQGNETSGQTTNSGRPVSVSADGRFVAFQSGANNLVPGDTNHESDVFVHDRQTGATTRVSVDSNGAQANNQNSHPSLSGDGRYVAFTSSASNLVPGDAGGHPDIFVHDIQTGSTTRVSVDSNGVQGNGDSFYTSVSLDGRYVAFTSIATNFVPVTSSGQVYVHDRQTGTTSIVSVDSNGVNGYGVAYAPSISSDGRYVAFFSQATNLVPGDTNGAFDIFVRDMLTGTTRRVSVDSGGVQGDGASGFPEISGDGRYVTFDSTASNLVPGDTNLVLDIFVHDLQTGATTRASINSSGFQGNARSWASSISADGRFVAFQSSSTDLVTGDINDVDDIFLIDRTCTGTVSTYCTAKTNSLGCVPSIGSMGLPSQSGSDNFYVSASNVRNNKLGMMLWSLGSANNPFFGGTLCLAQPLKRTPGQNSGGSPTGNDCTGTYSYHFTQAYMLQQILGANTTIYAQYWMRDPGFAPPNNIGLTNGLRFTICQ